MRSLSVLVYWTLAYLFIAEALWAQNNSSRRPSKSSQSLEQQRAKHLQSAYIALVKSDQQGAQAALAEIDPAGRRTPYRLLASLARDPIGLNALLGHSVPNPDRPVSIVVLHPHQPLATYLGADGVLLLHDLTAKSTSSIAMIESSRKQPLINGRYSRDGKFFAAGDVRGGVIVWRTDNWTETNVFTKGNAPVRSVALSYDGTRVLAEMGPGVVLWDRENDRELKVVARRLQMPTPFVFANQTHRFATANHVSVFIHDPESFKPVIQCPQGPHPAHIVFSPDDRLIASGLRGSMNKWVDLFDVKTGQKYQSRMRHHQGVTSLLFIDDGATLIATDAGGSTVYWDVQSGTKLLETASVEPVFQASVSKSESGTFTLWNRRRGARYFAFVD